MFLSKIDKCLIDLALPRIFIEFGGRATLVEAFAEVDQCNCTLCQHDATDLISLLVVFNKSRKFPIVTAGLAATEDDNTYHCWYCG